MPTIGYYKNLLFFFYAYDILERMHLHVFNSRGRKTRAAKIWIENGIEVFDTGTLSNEEVNLCVKLCEVNLKDIVHQIELFKQGKKTTRLKLKLK